MSRSYTDDEMEELIASGNFDKPYLMPLTACVKGHHASCHHVRQPTNHIDPRATVCTCECHGIKYTWVQDPDEDEGILMVIESDFDDEELSWDEEASDDEVEWSEDESVEWSEDEEELDWSEV